MRWQERSLRRTQIDVLPQKGEHESTRHRERESANQRVTAREPGRARKQSWARGTATEGNWLPRKAHPLEIFTWPLQNQSEGGTTSNKIATHLGPYFCHPIPPLRNRVV